MMTQPAERRYTLEEYLEQERTASTRSEYLRGRIYAMAGGSPAHNQIAFNLITVLGARLADGRCQGYTSDQRVHIEATGLSTYPDVTVTCEEPVYAPDDPQALTNPTLLIEVLSDSTEAYDRGDKFRHYQQLPSLREYLIVSQRYPRIERYALNAGGSWDYMPIEGLEARLHLDAPACDLPLAGVYRGITFTAPSPER